MYIEVIEVIEVPILFALKVEIVIVHNDPVHCDYL
jgi:hypothetical protein